ncbi:DegT/DnrJ/EryC1/StrS family aminotransferase [uncultured Bacteroides sp.]|uniref:DegT/DnrJ/EryC1/StrS family aminotransferase n=1 Tax=uncultured Bacteroides sp. TaxID=162156 RepID=UPI002AA79536|nr:DegT/DnrJ/EryC1/StrS family aminotransferase [uncultured Bacteroides sp.]
MQFRDLKKQYQVLKKDIDAAMMDVAASSAYIMGKPVKELETELAEYVGVKRCITCANGTEALTLALKVWNIGSGDAVFVPDFTFFASAEVISLEGATPVFVDVEKETFNISVSDLEKKIAAVKAEGKLTPKVIIAVDLFGLPANYIELRKTADRHKLLILEDGAQGFGGYIGEQKACSFGDISATSFFPAKPLGCYGDGGAVFMNNDDWATLAESFRVHGKGSFKYDNVRIGMNSRLDTLQAGILKVKFKAFKEYELEDINKAAAKYTAKLQGHVITPVIPEGFYCSWAQYTIRLANKEQRDGLQAVLKEQGIPSMVYYPTPMHGQTAYQNVGDKYGVCPNTIELCETVLSLPIHPYITDEDIDTVCNLISQQ